MQRQSITFYSNQMSKVKSLISSNDLAVLIVDSLVDKKIVKKDDFEKAVIAASEEIHVRKALGDYWCGECVNSNDD